MNIGWDFPSNNNGRTDGLNDSGIHHFTEAPIVSMTREVLQDSLDAAISKDKPVIVKFELHQLAQQSFPQIKELKNIFHCGINTWTSHPETMKFFSDGLNVLQQKTIPVLTIRDFNTTGLENVDQKINGSFASLVKSVGVTFKDASASGSFGIGKHAPFAASSIRTMFYSTYNRQNIFAMQGVSKLASFDSGGGDFTQGTGYYGIKDKLEPVLNLKGYHPMFERLEYGTDKFIMGFTGKADWADDVVETILLSYLVAIMEEKLEVHIIGLQLSKRNIGAVVHYIMTKRPQSTVRQYYEAYTSTERVERRHYFKTFDGELEPIKVSILAKEGFNRRVSMYRGTGMKIFDKDRFRAPIDFAGVMVVEGGKLNAVLRKMEPPTHDKWAAALYKVDVKYAETLLKQIYDWLNSLARELAKIQVADTIELRGLEGILPDVTKEQAPLKEIDEQALQEQVKSFVYKQIKTQPKGIKTKVKKRKNTFLDEEKDKKKPKSEGENDKNNSNKDKSDKRKKAIISNVRIFCINEEKGLYRFVVNPKGAGDLNLAIHIASEDGSKTPIPIKSVTNVENGEAVTFENNIIGPLMIDAKEKLVFNIQFEDKERYSLEVTV